jgi:hypothetical protein
LAFISVAHGELAREMDLRAIERVFEDPDEASAAATKPSWLPNDQVGKVVPTICVNNNRDYNPKNL